MLRGERRGRCGSGPVVRCEMVMKSGEVGNMEVFRKHGAECQRCSLPSIADGHGRRCVRDALLVLGNGN